MIFILLLVAAAGVVSPEVLSSEDQFLQHDLAQVTFEIEHLKSLLIRECPQYVAFNPQIFRQLRTRRNLRTRIELKLKRESYNQLLKAMIECRKSKIPTTTKLPITTPSRTTAASSATTPPTTATRPPPTTLPTMTKPLTTTTSPTTSTTPPTTPPMTTTATSMTTMTLPPAAQAACRSALNLRQSWRLDHAGSNINGKGSGKACDTRDFRNSGYPWFRFAGAAGTRLLNKCPPPNSCGTDSGIWSGSQPQNDGIIGVINNFTAYGSHTGGCNQFLVQMQSINCGRGDVIYKLQSQFGCSLAFCGMN